MTRGQGERGHGARRSNTLFFSLWDMAEPLIMEKNLRKTSGELNQGEGDKPGDGRGWRRYLPTRVVGRLNELED